MPLFQKDHEVQQKNKRSALTLLFTAADANAAAAAVATFPSSSGAEGTLSVDLDCSLLELEPVWMHRDKF